MGKKTAFSWCYRCATWKNWREQPWSVLTIASKINPGVPQNTSLLPHSRRGLLTDLFPSVAIERWLDKQNPSSKARQDFCWQTSSGRADIIVICNCCPYVGVWSHRKCWVGQTTSMLRWYLLALKDMMWRVEALRGNIIDRALGRRIRKSARLESCYIVWPSRLSLCESP
jgi:hypothetical protein